jgi:2-hydroxy-4-carboxymuconate semialdehyde hemiacetal dehydrogenase
MNLVLAGAGAAGVKHLDGLKRIDSAQVVSLVSRRLEPTSAVAQEYGIPHVTTDLAEALALPGVDAVILATPPRGHAAQAVQCLKAGKHVQIEIPLADSWADAMEVARVQQQTGLICMVGHTRRFNPSHQWIHKRIRRGELSLLQLDVQDYFFRRTNTNTAGRPRSWTDHLLWHHAAHTVDLFRYQTADEIVVARAVQGPLNRDLGIAMDMSVQLKSRRGAVCTLSLSFNNDGLVGTSFRYICDNGTYVARHDDLANGHEERIDVSDVDVSMHGIELQDREFLSAIRAQREPNASVQQVLPSYRVLNELQNSLA